ncbi:Periplasmic [NiFeSe] hydrogenase small subunit precursor [Roseovarius sp. THAF27]|uniref:NADH-quinone oxidoreductase subunit B family protein n=1 Tax=Roseovarius TaxID=74030 RepID=UPI001268F4EC|nr:MULTISPECIES: HupU protein [Roseovarius]MBY5988963.1 HupU protein [Roseovarius atlanticus]MBY6124355.1 HupU protein [Roseovarius atlanticus]MBY6148850.1 HupU protein [Roseovarius atlanticus]QFT81211.1 Periplasmic [NiFeSe] hydrogenase small subunit precursor [Roseovarius sp. THAF27]
MNILWLQSAGCGGCTMSLLNAESPGVFELLDNAGLRFLWHPALSQETGGEVRRILDDAETGRVPLDILCVEGSILTGPKGTGRFQMLSGTGRSMLDWVESLAPRAAHVVAVGTCATYGGVTSAGGNPAGAIGVQYDGRNPGGALPQSFRSRSGLPVINVAGCPTHPDWVTETLMLIAAGEMHADALDALQRPLFYAEHLVHHACPKNEFYEYKASAEKPGQMGCMMEHLGCVGTQAVGDCNIRGWNGGSSCTRAGYACINCTAPEFEEPNHPFSETPKFAGIPVGLPSDMPKAWFMALASLSKAATPKRLSDNAVADRIKVTPTLGGKRK